MPEKSDGFTTVNGEQGGRRKRSREEVQRELAGGADLGHCRF